MNVEGNKCDTYSATISLLSSKIIVQITTRKLAHGCF